MNSLKTVSYTHLDVYKRQLHRKIKFGRKEQCGEQRSYLPDSFLYISKFQEEVFVGRDGKRPGGEQICFIQTLFQDIP